MESKCYRCGRMTPFYLAHIPCCDQCASALRAMFAPLAYVPPMIAARYLAEFQPGLNVKVKPEHQVTGPDAKMEWEFCRYCKARRTVVRKAPDFVWMACGHSMPIQPEGLFEDKDEYDGPRLFSRGYEEP